MKTMKIAYLLYWNPHVQSGVKAKVEEQAQEWKALGIDHHLFYIYPGKSEQLDEYSSVLGAELNWLPSKLKAFVNKILLTRYIGRKIKEFNPDVLYVRQTYYYPGIISILRDFKNCMELNTIDLFEIKTQNLISRLLMRFGREKLNRSIDAYVSVSEEILTYYSSYDVPKIVIANGIDLTRLGTTSKVKQASPQVLFIGSSGASWHGVDKLEKLILSCPEFFFHIVGYESYSKFVNAKFYGFLNKSELIDLYPIMDVGLGSLALHRINIKEASPLKVREYIACGLPCILPYIDTDLKEGENILVISNEELNIDNELHRIKDFITRKHFEDSSTMALEKIGLSAKGKEEKRISFLKDI